MKVQSVRRTPSLALATLMLAIASPSLVQADAPAAEVTQEKTTAAKSTGVSSSFSVARPNADFTATAGFAYFVQQHGIRVTLPPAADAEGKEILIVPSYPPRTHFWKMENRYYLKCSDGEHIIYNGYAIDRYKNWMNKVGIQQQELFISDGKNWNLLVRSGAYI